MQGVAGRSLPLRSLPAGRALQFSSRSRASRWQGSEALSERAGDANKRAELTRRGCENLRQLTLKGGKPTLKRERLTLSRGKLDPRRSTPSTPSSLTVVRAAAGEPGRQESTHLRCARECPYSARAGKTGRRACSRGNARYVPRLHQAHPTSNTLAITRVAACSGLVRGAGRAPLQRRMAPAVNEAIGLHVQAGGAVFMYGQAER